MQGIHVLCFNDFGTVQPVSIFIEEGFTEDKEAVYIHMVDDSDKIVAESDSLFYMKTGDAIGTWPEIIDALKDVHYVDLPSNS